MVLDHCSVRESGTLYLVPTMIGCLGVLSVYVCFRLSGSCPISLGLLLWARLPGGVPGWPLVLILCSMIDLGVHNWLSY